MKKTVVMPLGKSVIDTIKAIETITNGNVTSYSIKGRTLTACVEEVEPYYDPENECVMCGGEWPLNDEGYCSRCWMIWNS